MQYRDVDGFLITGKNSGTHWLKFMLSCAIAEEFGVAPPLYSSGTAADLDHQPSKMARPAIGYPGSAARIPFRRSRSPGRGFTGLLPHPPVVVLVRDIDAAMRSNYVKWRERYGGSTVDYVRGDPSGRRYVADLWWYMHFFNRWGDVSRAQPGNVLVVRYEDLLAAPASCLRRITAHYGIRLGDQAINAALRYVDRDTIRALLDPSDDEVVVPSDDAADRVVFTRDDAVFMQKMMRRHLRSDFGYAYPLAGADAGAIERTA